MDDSEGSFDLFFPAYTMCSIRRFSDMLGIHAFNLCHRLRRDRVIWPVAIFLVIDEEHGGDHTAQELVKRFHLLDLESKTGLEMYFLGWEIPSRDDPRLSETGRDKRGLRFDLQSFDECRQALRDWGVRSFGANADLILLDMEGTPWEVVLHLERAVRIDLAEGVASGRIATLGAFLQTILDTAEPVLAAVKEGLTESPTADISDGLGALTLRTSIIDFLLDKWGAALGGGRLARLAVRNIGHPVTVESFPAPKGDDDLGWIEELGKGMEEEERMYKRLAEEDAEKEARNTDDGPGPGPSKED